MNKNQKWQIEQSQKTYIDQYQRQSLFSYKFPDKEAFAFDYCKSQTKWATQRNKLWEKMMLKKWREIKLTNKFEVYLDIFETKSKFEVKIVYFFLEGLWNEHFWCLEERFKVQTIRHRSEKKFKTSYQKAILLICYNLSQLLKVRWKRQR